MISEAVVAVQDGLAARAEPQTQDWWNRYLKGAIEFRGVKMAGIRRVIHEWHTGEGAEWPTTRLRELAVELIRQPLAEDKLAGILLLQEVLLPARAIPWRTELKRWATLFDRGHIADWNTCDWFCVRVLGPLSRLEGEAAARAIASWASARNLWRRRAAGVAFVDLAPAGDQNFPGFTDMLIEVCERTVLSPERFAQTGTGWVLRELSKAEPDRVAYFIQSHLGALSREGVRMSVARLPDRDRRRLLRAHGANPDSRPGRR